MRKLTLLSTFLLCASILFGQATQVMDIYTGSGDAYPFGFMEYNNELYFTAYPNGVSMQAELWKTNGTNTVSVLTPTNNLIPMILANYNGKLYFSYGNQNNGSMEGLWEYDGVNVPTLILNSNPNGGDVGRHFVEFNGKLYFTGIDSIHGSELWQYDGINPPNMVADLNVGTAGAIIANLTIFQNKLFFSAKTATNTDVLMMYDGVNTPTVVANDLKSSGFGYNGPMPILNGKLYFIAYTISGDFTSSTIFEYDGVNPATSVVSNVGANEPIYATSLYTERFGVLYFFIVNNGGGSHICWEYDGINPAGPASNPSLVFSTMYNNEAYYFGHDATYGTELWKTDGVNEMRLTDINPTGGIQSEEKPFLYQNKLYFDATDGTTGQELWAYDPSIFNSINKQKDFSLQIHPNPAQNQVQIKANATISGIEVYDVLGKKVLEQSTSLNRLDVSNLLNGIYWLHIHTDKCTEIKELVKI